MTKAYLKKNAAIGGFISYKVKCERFSNNLMEGA